MTAGQIGTIVILALALTVMGGGYIAYRVIREKVRSFTRMAFGSDTIKGSIENMKNEKVGVVSVVYVSYDANLSKQKLQEYIEKDTESIYMLYCVPLDTDFSTLENYPSKEKFKHDLM